MIWPFLKKTAKTKDTRIVDAAKALEEQLEKSKEAAKKTKEATDLFDQTWSVAFGNNHPHNLETD